MKKINHRDSSVWIIGLMECVSNEFSVLIKTHVGIVWDYFAKRTWSVYLVHIKELRMNFNLPQQQTRWDLIYVTPIKSLSRKLVSVVQYNIQSCFRSEIRSRNPHTPIPKLALVDTSDSSGKILEWTSKERELSWVRKKIGLRIFFVEF